MPGHVHRKRAGGSSMLTIWEQKARRRNRLRRLGFGSAVVAAASTLAVLAPGGGTKSMHASAARVKSSTPAATRPVVDAANSVYLITTGSTCGGTFAGTGWAIAADDVVTNGHVVAG